MSIYSKEVAKVAKAFVAYARNQMKAQIQRQRFSLRRHPTDALC